MNIITIWRGILTAGIITTLFLLGMSISAGAQAAESFHVEFRPLKHDVLAAEFVWQAENIVDLQQTLRIAEQPGRFHECGTMSAFTGPHPTQAQVWLWSAAFGVGHYAVAQMLTNAHFDNAARVWEGVSIGYKTWDIDRNRRVGLGT